MRKDEWIKLLAILIVGIISMGLLIYAETSGNIFIAAITFPMSLLAFRVIDLEL